MSNSSEFCGDHVNLFRGFLARMSHPNKLLLQRVSVDMTRIARCACADSMWNLSDRPKVRRTAGRSVSMQPAVKG